MVGHGALLDARGHGCSALRDVLTEKLFSQSIVKTSSGNRRLTRQPCSGRE